MSPAINNRRFEARDELIAALAERLERTLTAPVDATGRALMLSGGNTPLPAYQALAARSLRAATGLALLYSDERYVPSSSQASNYRQTRVLLDSLALTDEQVLRVRTELPLEAAAADYERRLRSLLGAEGRIRLGLLGLGADGHTASLFRAPDLERARGRLALAVHRPDGRDAVSVTPLLLERVTDLIFVVAGADKRTALEALLARSPNSVAYRAVGGCPAIEVWSDREAWP